MREMDEALRPRSVLFVFVDGVGLGPPGPANPLVAGAYPTLERLAAGHAWTSEAPPVRTPAHVFAALDVTLGVEGLPQSGTGQTALYTGVNGPALAGRHYGPFPHSATFAALAERNVFARLLRAGVGPERLAFANAYPDRYFAYAERTGRHSTAPRMALATGLRLRTAADVAAGRALTAEITGAAWRERLGLDVPLRTPDEAGRTLAALARAHTFTLYEVYDTDKAGHARDPAQAARVLADVDGLLGGALAALDPATDLLVVSSDHGNLEDLGRKTHTRAPVPLAAWGRGAGAFADATTVLDVAPALERLLTRTGPAPEGTDPVSAVV